MHAIILVLLAGISINSHNTGGIKDFDEAVKDTKASFENSVADYSKLND
jgi:hypothetical protein